MSYQITPDEQRALSILTLLIVLSLIGYFLFST